MGKIYMIGAMKGGVGKSVSVFNLAYSLKKRGMRVLAVDFDPQSNLTTCFGAEDVDMAISDLMMNVIEEEDLQERGEYIWERDGVDFIPSSMVIYDKMTDIVYLTTGIGAWRIFVDRYGNYCLYHKNRYEDSMC